MSFSGVRNNLEFSTFSIHDPGIDLDKSDVKSIDNYSDKDSIVFKDGHEPTVFYCEGLTLKMMTEITNSYAYENKPLQSAYKAFQYGVKKIDNLPSWSDKAIIKAHPQSYISEKWLETSGLPTEVISEIGTEIITKSKLNESQIKN